MESELEERLLGGSSSLVFGQLLLHSILILATNHLIFHSSFKESQLNS